jgi:hypothetical protein
MKSWTVSYWYVLSQEGPEDMGLLRDELSLHNNFFFQFNVDWMDFQFMRCHPRNIRQNELFKFCWIPKLIKERYASSAHLTLNQVARLSSI